MKKSLNTYLIGPVAILFTLATLVTALQSYQTTNQFIRNFLDSHTQVIADSIMTQLDDFFSIAITSAKTNVDLIDSGAIDPHNRQDLAHLFLAGIDNNPYLTYVSMGFENGEYVGAGRSVASGEINLYTSYKEDEFRFNRYALDQNFTVGKLIDFKDHFVATERDWYKTAKANGRATWYPVYKYASQDALGIGISVPVYDANTGGLIGVLTADLALNRIANFLQQVDLGNDGLVFIADSHSNLIATSSEDPVYKRDTPPSDQYIQYQIGNFTDGRVRAVSPILTTQNPLKADVFTFDNKNYHFDRQIYTDDLGQNLTVGVILSVDAYTGPYTRALVERIATGILFLLVIGALLILILQRIVLPPIQRLVNAHERIRHRDYDARVETSNIKELAILTTGFNETAEALQNYDKIEKLYIAHEKMATLGGLVSGITHEINTPLGLAITVTSFIEQNQKQLTQMLGQNKADSQEALQVSQEISEDMLVLIRNLTRAADLIKSFKAIAVDQSHELEVTFDAVELVQNITLTLKHQYKQGGHTINIKGKSPLYINSYPGAITQILTNLIMNSILHGFKDIKNGLIGISLVFDRQELTILYTDNGRGMTPEVLEQLFVPFFTTNRAGGGTGIGMSIIKTIIYEQLKGSIEVKSEPDQGVEFIIHLPIR